MTIQSDTEYEWDAAKARANLEKHGVAFDAIRGFDWDSAETRADLRAGYPEGRLVSLGLIGGRLHHVAYVIRRAVRVISLRKASNLEVQLYEAAKEHA